MNIQFKQWVMSLPGGKAEAAKIIGKTPRTVDAYIQGYRLVSLECAKLIEEHSGISRLRFLYPEEYN